MQAKVLEKRQLRLTLRVMGGGGALLGPGKIALLEAIESAGSISAGARALSMSYRRAWLLIEEMNLAFDQAVVDTATGGVRGGGAQLTAFGADLIQRYRQLERKTSAAVVAELAFLSSHLRNRD